MTVDIATTVLVPAAVPQGAAAGAGAYDLVDLATARDELALKPSDVSNDVWLARAINQVSRAIRNHCNRVFQIEQVEDRALIQQDPYPYQTPGGFPSLALSRWPLANFALSSLATPALAGDATLSVTGTPLAGIVSGPGLAIGTTASVVNGTVLIAPAAAAPMPAGTPIAFGIEVRQTLSSNAGVPHEQVLAADRDYRIDADRGLLTRLDAFTGTARNWEAAPVTITYSAGYATLPEDVAYAALRWLRLRYSERARDPLLKSVEQPGIGTETYWVGGPPGSGGIPEEIADLLANYRVPVVG